MDEVTEDCLPENSIILTPEQLAKLGVTIPSLSSIPSDSSSTSNQRDTKDNGKTLACAHRKRLEIKSKTSPEPSSKKCIKPLSKTLVLQGLKESSINNEAKISCSEVHEKNMSYNPEFVNGAQISFENASNSNIQSQYINLIDARSSSEFFSEDGNSREMLTVPKKIEVLSNTKVNFSQDYLKKLISEKTNAVRGQNFSKELYICINEKSSLKQNKIESFSQAANEKIPLEGSSQVKNLDNNEGSERVKVCRENLMRILKTDKQKENNKSLSSEDTAISSCGPNLSKENNLKSSLKSKSEFRVRNSQIEHTNVNLLKDNKSNKAKGDATLSSEFEKDAVYTRTLLQLKEKRNDDIYRTGKNQENVRAVNDFRSDFSSFPVNKIDSKILLKPNETDLSKTEDLRLIEINEVTSDLDSRKLKNESNNRKPTENEGVNWCKTNLLKIPQTGDASDKTNMNRLILKTSPVSSDCKPYPVSGPTRPTGTKDLTKSTKIDDSIKAGYTFQLNKEEMTNFQRNKLEGESGLNKSFEAADVEYFKNKSSEILQAEAADHKTFRSHLPTDLSDERKEACKKNLLKVLQTGDTSCKNNINVKSEIDDLSSKLSEESTSGNKWLMLEAEGDLNKSSESKRKEACRKNLLKVLQTGDTSRKSNINEITLNSRDNSLSLSPSTRLSSPLGSEDLVKSEIDDLSSKLSEESKSGNKWLMLEAEGDLNKCLESKRKKACRKNLLKVLQTGDTSRKSNINEMPLKSRDNSLSLTPSTSLSSSLESKDLVKPEIYDLSPKLCEESTSGKECLMLEAGGDFKKSTESDRIESCTKNVLKVSQTEDTICKRDKNETTLDSRDISLVLSPSTTLKSEFKSKSWLNSGCASEIHDLNSSKVNSNLRDRVSFKILSKFDRLDSSRVSDTNRKVNEDVNSSSTIELKNNLKKSTKTEKHMLSKCDDSLKVSDHYLQTKRDSNKKEVEEVIQSGDILEQNFNAITLFAKTDATLDIPIQQHQKSGKSTETKEKIDNASISDFTVTKNKIKLNKSCQYKKLNACREKLAKVLKKVKLKKGVISKKLSFVDTKNKFTTNKSSNQGSKHLSSKPSPNKQSLICKIKVSNIFDSFMKSHDDFSKFLEIASKSSSDKTSATYDKNFIKSENGQSLLYKTKTNIPDNILKDKSVAASEEAEEKFGKSACKDKINSEEKRNLNCFKLVQTGATKFEVLPDDLPQNAKPIIEHNENSENCIVLSKNLVLNAEEENVVSNKSVIPPKKLTDSFATRTKDSIKNNLLKILQTGTLSSLLKNMPQPIVMAPSDIAKSDQSGAVMKSLLINNGQTRTEDEGMLSREDKSVRLLPDLGRSTVKNNFNFPSEANNMSEIINSYKVCHSNNDANANAHSSFEVREAPYAMHCKTCNNKDLLGLDNSERPFIDDKIVQAKTTDANDKTVEAKTTEVINVGTSSNFSNNLEETRTQQLSSFDADKSIDYRDNGLSKNNINIELIYPGEEPPLLPETAVPKIRLKVKKFLVNEIEFKKTKNKSLNTKKICPNIEKSILTQNVTEPLAPTTKTNVCVEQNSCGFSPIESPSISKTNLKKYPNYVENKEITKNISSKCHTNKSKAINKISQVKEATSSKPCKYYKRKPRGKRNSNATKSTSTKIGMIKNNGKKCNRKTYISNSLGQPNKYSEDLNQHINFSGLDQSSKSLDDLDPSNKSLDCLIRTNRSDKLNQRGKSSEDLEQPSKFPDALVQLNKSSDEQITPTATKENSFCSTSDSIDYKDNELLRSKINISPIYPENESFLFPETSVPKVHLPVKKMYANKSELKKRNNSNVSQIVKILHNRNISKPSSSKPNTKPLRPPVKRCAKIKKHKYKSNKVQENEMNESFKKDKARTGDHKNILDINNKLLSNIGTIPQKNKKSINKPKCVTFNSGDIDYIKVSNEAVNVTSLPLTFEEQYECPETPLTNQKVSLREEVEERRSCLKNATTEKRVYGKGNALHIKNETGVGNVLQDKFDSVEKNPITLDCLHGSNEKFTDATSNTRLSNLPNNGSEALVRNNTKSKNAGLQHGISNSADSSEDKDLSNSQAVNIVNMILNQHLAETKHCLLQEDEKIDSQSNSTEENSSVAALNLHPPLELSDIPPEPALEVVMKEKESQIVYEPKKLEESELSDSDSESQIVMGFINEAKYAGNTYIGENMSGLTARSKGIISVRNDLFTNKSMSCNEPNHLTGLQREKQIKKDLISRDELSICKSSQSVKLRMSQGSYVKFNTFLNFSRRDTLEIDDIRPKLNKEKYSNTPDDASNFMKSSESKRINDCLRINIEDSDSNPESIITTVPIENVEHSVEFLRNRPQRNTGNRTSKKSVGSNAIEKNILVSNNERPRRNRIQVRTDLFQNAQDSGRNILKKEVNEVKESKTKGQKRKLNWDHDDDLDSYSMVLRKRR